VARPFFAVRDVMALPLWPIGDSPVDPSVAPRIGSAVD